MTQVNHSIKQLEILFTLLSELEEENDEDKIELQIAGYKDTLMIFTIDLDLMKMLPIESLKDVSTRLDSYGIQHLFIPCGICVESFSLKKE